MPNRPVAELAKRPLQFIWIVDCSGSMSGSKIGQLNYAIRSALPAMKDVANENPNADIFLRVLRFSDGAQWLVSQPTRLEDFNWNDLDADGVTDMGHAMTELAKALDMKNMPDRGLAPVLVLVSDGQPTDDFNTGLKALMDQPWGKKSVRIAIGIGSDVVEDPLIKFIGNAELKPLRANNSRELANRIKWASTVPIKAASNPASRAVGQPDTGHVPIPAPPSDSIPPTSADDVF